MLIKVELMQLKKGMYGLNNFVDLFKFMISCKYIICLKTMSSNMSQDINYK